MQSRPDSSKRKHKYQLNIMIACSIIRAEMNNTQRKTSVSKCAETKKEDVRKLLKSIGFHVEIGVAVFNL